MRVRLLFHRLFLVGVIGKGIDGLLEIAGGVLLLVTDPARLYGWARALTQHELLEDPSDLVAGYLIHATRHLSESTRLFGAAFLLGHGAVKTVLVVALLQRRLRAYPAAIVVLSGFVAYQLYRFTHTGSVALLALSVVDVFVIALTWLEYRRLRAEPAREEAR